MDTIAIYHKNTRLFIIYSISVVVYLLYGIPIIYSQITTNPSTIDLGIIGYTQATFNGASNMFSFEIINQSADDIYVGSIAYVPDRGRGYLLHGINPWSEGIFGPYQRVWQSFYIKSKDTGIISGNLVIPVFSRKKANHDTIKIPISGRIEKLPYPFLTDIYLPDLFTTRCSKSPITSSSTYYMGLINPTDDTLTIIDISSEAENGVSLKINSTLSVYDTIGTIINRKEPIPTRKTVLPAIVLPTMPVHFSMETGIFWLPNSTATVRATLLRPNGDTITARSNIRFGYATFTQKLILVGPDRYPLYIRYNTTDSTSLPLRAIFNHVPAEQLSLDQIVFRGPRSTQFSLISNDPTLPPVQFPLTMSCDSTIGRSWAAWNIRFAPTLPPGRMTDTIVALFSYRDSTTGIVVRDSSWWTFETVVSAPLAVPNSAPFIGTLRAYPNPTAGMLLIDLPEHSAASVRIDVIDITGQTVLSKTISQPPSILSLDIHDLPSGYYNILLSNDKQRYWNGDVTVAK